MMKSKKDFFFLCLIPYTFSILRHHPIENKEQKQMGEKCECINKCII